MNTFQFMLQVLLEPQCMKKEYSNYLFIPFIFVGHENEFYNIIAGNALNNSLGTFTQLLYFYYHFILCSYPLGWSQYQTSKLDNSTQKNT